MAANKRKILEAARKYAQKGAKDRALKEYEQLLRLDPKDAKLRLEIGDAHRRWGQVEEAIAAYTKVADQYTKEGFDARAVAVYKQIQNLAPESFDSFEPLAELYQRMGLTAEAIAALQTAADGFHRQGKKKNALDLLRKMATLDPTNTGSRLKVADLLRQEKLFEDAIEEYEQVAAELQRQGVTEAVGTVLERILELDPNRPSAVRMLTQNLIARGMGERAEPYAKRLLDANAEAPENYELLAEVYRLQKREDALADVYRRLADLYRRRGDEENARQILQRFVPADALAPRLDREVLLGGDEESITDESSLIDEEFLDDGFAEEMLEERAEPKPAVKGPAKKVAEETVLVQRGGVRRTEAEQAAPTGDTEQLFAEASVYLRYGKRAQAIENLHAILVQNPRHRAALEKLGDAHADAREPQEAVEAWLRAAELAREESDIQVLVVLRDRIAALDEEAGAQVAEWLPEGAGAPDIDLSEPEESLEVSAGAEPAAAEDDEPEIDLGDIEIEIDDDEPEPAKEPAKAPTPVKRASAIPLRPKSAGTSQRSAAGDSSSTSQQIGEDLEEADFYFQQGLHNEAEAIYQRVLSLAPNHPLALVRLGEIAAAQGTDPGATSGGVAVPTPEADADEAATPPDVDIGRDLADWNEDLAGEPAAAVASTADSDDDLLIEVEDEDSGEAAAEDDETDEVAAPLRAEPDSLEQEADALSLSGEEDEQEEEEEADPEDDTASESGGSRAATPAPISAGSEANYDLAAELSEAFDEANGRSGSGASPADDGFASVFGEFKKGVSRMLSAGDHQAHYDLGIAYREMGLLSDAVSEFEAAMTSPARKIDCLHMLGLCTLERGAAADAARYFEQALAAPDATPEQRLAVRFELGRAFEAQGDKARARDAFQAVAAVDPSFCDVEEWLERLDEDAKPAPAAAASESDFESFEDLMGDHDEPKQAKAAHESFDDVIAEANQEEAEPEALEEPLEDELPPPSPRAVKPGRKPPGAKPGRKKKISFV